MDDFSKKVGVNLAKLRNARGLTLQEVSAKLSHIECNISPQTLSMIENGKRRIYADQLAALCEIYGCSLSTVIYPKEKRDSVIADAIMSEPSEVKNIVLWAITEWRGNTTALWKFLGLYIALPPQIRHMIAGMGVATYNYAKQTKQVNKLAPPVDITYITKEYRKLL